MENQQNSSLMPLNDLLGKSFEVYKERVLVLAGLMAINFITILIIILVSLAVIFLTGINGAINQNLSFLIPLIVLGGILIIAAVITAVVVGLWIQVSMICAVKEKIGVKESLMMGKSKIWQFFWISFLRGLAVLAGLIFFIIPGIIFSIWFSMALYVLVAEGLKGTSAIKRSKQLVKGNGWDVFLRFLVAGLIIGLISWVISWVPVLGAIVAALFISPFGLIFGYLLYEDLKRVKGNV